MCSERITAPAGVQTLEARVREISYQSAGYTVLQCRDTSSDKIVTVVGDLELVRTGEHLCFEGHWTHHPRFGSQFKAQGYTAVLPSTSAEIEAFLASGLLEGVGPAMAKRLVEHFGDQVLQILDKDPQRLREVPTIGDRKYTQITTSWQERRGLHPVADFLKHHGLPASLGPQLYQEYGGQALQVLQSQPYDLMHLWGQGFAAADRFARSLAADHWQPLHPERLQAGLKHSLQQATRDGHLYLPLPELLDRGQQLLGVPPTALVSALEALIERQDVYPEPRPNGEPHDLYLRRYGFAEHHSAERLATLLKDVPSPDAAVLQSWLEDYQQEHGIRLSEGQAAAVAQAAASKVFILTGGPGTGKTTVSKAILAWFKHQKQRCLLASPTGRAARRLSEVTGQEATTVHRLLEFDPVSKHFQRDESQPLKTDVLMLDEVSMVDMRLFCDLLRALPDATRLILIGDQDQLPSVGAGAVLAELLHSGVIPTVQLTEIYRQAQASRIVQNAHRVNHGEAPELLPPTGKNRHEDAFFIATHTPESTQAQLIDLVTRRLPAAGHAPADIQVLCPMKRGLIGTQSLNTALQEALNPPQPKGNALQSGQRWFRPGDRVIQLKNNYELEVFNGDLGWVLEADGPRRRLKVRFSERTVDIEGEAIGELDLAYALTIHKSQGAEFPVVVMVLTRQHHVMLQRNLLYTGMTRAAKLLILVGEPEAITQAVRNDRLRRRYTRLGERLQRQVTATENSPPTAH